MFIIIVRRYKMVSEKDLNVFKELYKEFFDNLSEDYNEEICSFFMQIGKDYGSKKPKCLFVGKATNGWVGDSNNVDELFDKNNESRIINRNDEIEWVEKQSGSKDKYNTNKSAFWRLIKNVSINLFGQDEWYKFIAWTNIYKFALYDGNPNSYLQQIQRTVCSKIFDMEINYLKPDVIVFLTSNWEWFYNSHLEIKRESGNFHEWDGYKTYYQKINGTLFIHSMHPERKKEENHKKIISKIIKEEL
jgi:hypothetical protein